MTDRPNKAGSGPGTTSDPNQATIAEGPNKKAPETEVTPDPTPDDPKTGPGTTSDPNQANRT